MYLRLLCWALLLIMALMNASAHAACSGTNVASKTTLNEYFFGVGGGAPPNFLEIYSTSGAFPASWQDWSVDVYEGLNSKKTYLFNNSTATACTVGNKTWLTSAVPSGLRKQNALVLLKDQDGNYVDAFVFDNSSPPAPWPGAAASSWFPGLSNATSGCPALASALTSQAGLSGSTSKQNNMLVLKNYGNKDMARDPDGGPIWDLTSNTGAGTSYTRCVSNNANFTKTVDNGTPTPGSTVTFTLSLANTANSAMSGVQISDFLPPVLTYTSATSSNPADSPVTTATYATTDPNTGLATTATSVFWAPADVPAGTVSRLFIKMQVPTDATEGYSYVNTAQTTTGLSENQTDFASVTIGSPNTPSFAISVSPASSTTCTPALLGPQVTITAMSAANGGGTPLTTFNGTVTLTASTPNPIWYDDAGVALAGNTVTLTNGTVTLYLTDAVAETFTVSAVHVLANEDVMQGSSGNITFTGSSTGLALVDADLLSPAYGAVAGRPHRVRATISNCGSTAGTSGSISGTMYYIPGLNHPAGAAAPTINPGASSCPGSVALPLTSSGAPITLNFSSGQADFYLCSTDVGQYAVSLKLTGVPSGTRTVTGSSSNFTVRPFAVTATGFASGVTGNPAGSAAFTRAGTAFSGTLQAWRWVAGADTELEAGIQRGNGLPDSGISAASLVAANPGLTASFNGITNAAGIVSLVPASAPPVPDDGISYALGALSPSSATLNAGAATLTNTFNYSEVGNFKIGEPVVGTGYAATNYLGAAGLNVPILSDVVGRITPDHFVVASPTIVRRLGCTPDSAFTYMNETFRIGLTLTAHNAAGTVTQNYRDSYAFLDPATAQWPAASLGTNGSFGLGAFDGATDLSSRLSWSAAAGTWVAGSNTVTSDIRFTRGAAPDGPYAALALGVTPRDADGITVQTSALDLGGNRVQLLTNPLRFGRLRLFNGSVAGQSTLSMPLQAQFWSGKSWTLNNSDNCTLIPASAVAATAYRDAKSATMTAWPVGVGPDVQLTGGVGMLQLTKPGAIAAGTVDLCLDLHADPVGGVACSATGAAQPHLQGRWAPGAAYDNDPTGQATFGIYQPETRRTVHVRELF